MDRRSWTDEALRAGDEDSLGRLPHAHRAAALIHRTYSPSSSAVFGLSGPWGSGKSSLVNMIVEDLTKTYPTWAIARFTPWATSDLSGLLAEFYASLAAALPQRKRAAQVRQALAVTASVAAPAANLIPLAGGVAASGLQAAGDALAKFPPWQVAFDKASAELRKLNTPILVVVDDIDRLHADELTTLLKVVRLLRRFDGVQYLLAYDDETLFRSITMSGLVGVHDGSAERFVEKIVQYPLFVPPLLRHQQLARLNSGLAEVSRQHLDGSVSERRLSGLADCFSSLLTTPRSIDRYLAQLRHHLPLLDPDEVDDEDVQLLTLIRVSFPALFNLLPRYRDRLISGHTGEFKFGDRDVIYQAFDVTPLLEVVPPSTRGVARRLLLSLFPKVDASEPALSRYVSYRRQSVQHGEYFDRYFAMGILDHDVSDSAVATAISAAADGRTEALRAFVVGEGTDANVRGLVLSKGVRPSNMPESDAGRLQLARSLSAMVNDLPADDSEPFGPVDQLLGWVAGLVVSVAVVQQLADIYSVVEQLENTTLRIRLWRRVESALDDVGQAEAPGWYQELTARLVQQSADDFLAHLTQEDAAPITAGVGYQVHFVLKHEPAALRERISLLLEAGGVHVSHLAARLVSVRTITGGTPDWQLSPDFDQETFNQLAPAGFDDAWSRTRTQKVDMRDLSWSNRRAFAAGRVEPPPASC